MCEKHLIASMDDSQQSFIVTSSVNMAFHWLPLFDSVTYVINRLLFAFTGFVRSRPKVCLARLIAKLWYAGSNEKGRKMLERESNSQTLLGRKEIQKMYVCSLFITNECCVCVKWVSRGAGDGQETDDIVRGHQFNCSTWKRPTFSVLMFVFVYVSKRLILWIQQWHWCMLVWSSQ